MQATIVSKSVQTPSYLGDYSRPLIEPFTEFSFRNTDE
jgi:hypothetical protein